MKMLSKGCRADWSLVARPPYIWYLIEDGIKRSHGGWGAGSMLALRQ